MGTVGGTAWRGHFLASGHRVLKPEGLKPDQSLLTNMKNVEEKRHPGAG